MKAFRKVFVMAMLCVMALMVSAAAAEEEPAEETPAVDLQAVSQYGFVLDAESANQTGFVADRVKIVDTAGTVRILTTDDDYATGSSCLIGQLVSYSVDYNGEYGLQPAENQDNNVGGVSNAAKSMVTGAVGDWNTIKTLGYAFNGQPVSKDGGKDGGFYLENNGASVYPGVDGKELHANDETLFIIHTLDRDNKSQFTSYKGIINVPTITAADESSTVEMFWCTDAENVLQYVFIDAVGSNVEKSFTGSIALLAAKTSMARVNTYSDENAYFKCNAVVDGEIVTLRIAAEQEAGSALASYDEAAAQSAVYMVGATGRNLAVKIPEGTNLKNVSSVGSLQPDAGERYAAVEEWATGIFAQGISWIEVGGTESGERCRYNLASDAGIYYVTAEGAIAEIAANEITPDSNDHIVAVADTFTDEITCLIIQEVDSGSEGGETAPAEYRVESLTITDKDGNPLSAIPRDPFLATVSLTKLSSGGDTMVVLAAYSPAGQYQGLMYVRVKNLTDGAVVEVTLPVDNTAGKIGRLKAFPIASFAVPQPLGEGAAFGNS